MKASEATLPVPPSEASVGLLSKAALYVRTVRHMKPTQIFYYLVRRGLPPRRVRMVPAPAIRRGMKLKPPLLAHSRLCKTGAFTCINETRYVITSDRVDWHPSRTPRLWRYHLHYFDFLRQPDLSDEFKLSLVEDWIANNPQGRETAWEPYTCSLRIVNWIFWISALRTEIPSKVTDSLYQQYRWLRLNDERHILANHYFENLKAQLFGCYFFATLNERQIQRIERLVKRELKKQFLRDGAHYECSPSYHCRMTENLLDLYNFVSFRNRLHCSISPRDLNRLIADALLWLNDILMPDEQIPLFNDSAFDAAPHPRELFAYASKLGIYGKSRSATKIHKTHSGLYGARAGSDMLIVTCGDVKPSHQPGHWHCDMLSYELALDARRIVVDSGTSTYEPGRQRFYSRSTSAHNTVSVGEAEQSEIWGAFRVARRAKRLGASIQLQETGAVFSGSFEGFPTLATPVLHHRTIECTHCNARIETINVVDTLNGQGIHVLKNHIHFAPEISAALVERTHATLFQGSTPIARVDFDAEVNASIEEYQYGPGFGVCQKGDALVLSRTARLPCHLSYRISRIPRTEAIAEP